MSGLIGAAWELVHQLVAAAMAVAVWGWIVDRRRRAT